MIISPTFSPEPCSSPPLSGSLGVELKRDVTGDGPDDARILILTDRPTYGDSTSRHLLSDFAGRLLFDQFRKFGVLRSQIRVEAVCEEVPPGQKFWLLDPATQVAWKSDALRRVRALKPNVIVPLGDLALSVLTDQTSADKWQLSIIPSYDGTKVVPLLHPERIIKIFKDIPFLTFGAQRVVEESRFPELRETKRTFHTHPTLAEALAFLVRCESTEWLSCDIETGRGQITCIGFAPSPYEAMCIPTLPRDYSPEDFHILWLAIARTLAGPSKKIFQNGIYDTTYLSKYGIRVVNFAHDTMVAQKFLHCELPMGLDNVARLYTREPYWKDDAKDWGTRQNVEALYLYNCKDAAVTFEAAHAQRLDLAKRNLTAFYDNFLMRMTAPVAEMCWRGLPVKEEERSRLATEAEAKISELQKVLDAAALELYGKTINPRSPAQVKLLLGAAGFRLPVKQGKESSDKEALLKLRLKYPESKVLTPLIKLSAAQKRLSSYLNYAYDADGRMRYTLSLHGTETGRMSCYTDPWGRGYNAQTTPSELKSMFETDADSVFVEVDLRQAESRFVAWDGPEPLLMQMYNDGVDLHKFVAAQPELFNCRTEDVTKEQRQLGKKTGHASNYGMGANTLTVSCLKEMDLVLSKAKAEQMLAGYHRTFPGIRRWQQRIRESVIRDRKLRTPFGRERYFYDRPGDDLWKEAYAYRPQSTVTDTINHLVLHMFGHAALLVQIHDSLLMEVRRDKLTGTLERIRDQDAWNPRYALPGGEFRIPIEIKVGRNWKSMEEVFVG